MGNALLSVVGSMVDAGADGVDAEIWAAPGVGAGAEDVIGAELCVAPRQETSTCIAVVLGEGRTRMSRARERSAPGIVKVRVVSSTCVKRPAVGTA